MTLPVFNITYPEIVQKFYPEKECVAYGGSYSRIDWLGHTPVPQSELDSKVTELLALKYIEWVKVEAAVQREDASFKVIGTNMASMIRVYDIKKDQARQFMAKYDANEQPEASTYTTMSSELPASDQDILSSRYPLLYVEAEGTGVTLWQQCWAVLDQYRLSGEMLDPILGQIEAVRRAKIAEYMEATTEAEVRAISAPVWPDLSSLQAI